MATYFISDLHLSQNRPEASALFLKFLTTEAKNAEALYILGDLFESWIGDDNFNAHDEKVLEGLSDFTKSGIPLYFMHGNRDFLIGQQFVEKTHCTLLADPTVIQLYQDRVLLTHGDLLCTFDKNYQRFRKFVRHPLVQKCFLKLPLHWRRSIATQLREKSNEHFKHENAKAAEQSVSLPSLSSEDKKAKNTLWDVVLNTVYKFLREHQAYILIHGHTHKPEIQHFILDDHKALRIVLGEWKDKGCILAYSPGSTEFKIFS